MIQSRKVLAVAAVVLLLIVACGGSKSLVDANKGDEFISVAYKTLKSTAIAVDAAMRACEDLWQEGYIDQADVELIKQVHTVYRSAYMGAVQLLAQYKEKHDEALRTEIIDLVAKAERKAEDIQRLKTEYTPQK